MQDRTTLQVLAELLAPWTSARSTPEPNRLDVVLDSANLLDAVAALHAAGIGYLAAVTGLDQGLADGIVEVLYHFCAGPAVLTLRIRLPRDEPAVPSICPVIPSASFFERELSEMFGVRVEGLPGPGRLYTADDWPEGVYPMRKDTVV